MTDSKISDDISVISSVDEPLSDEDYVPQKKTVREIEIISVEKSYSDYVSNKRRTLPYINKYERAKILGIRAQQIAKGMKPLVKTTNKKNIYEIVEDEYKKKLIPLIIRRYLPDNTHEDWKLSDFIY
tara:strand:- start:339 stop:719 length:381 start_codon:yes stop_codon:yes gene_type:complete